MTRFAAYLVRRDDANDKMLIGVSHDRERATALFDGYRIPHILDKFHFVIERQVMRWEETGTKFLVE